MKPWWADGTFNVPRCEYYAVKKGLTLKLSGGEARPFLFQLMDSLEATKKALRDNEAVTNDEVAHLYVENFADRVRGFSSST
jgi:hypothetical protein